MPDWKRRRCGDQSSIMSWPSTHTRTPSSLSTRNVYVWLNAASTCPVQRTLKESASSPRHGTAVAPVVSDGLDASFGQPGEIGVVKVLSGEAGAGQRQPWLEAFESERSSSHATRNCAAPSDRTPCTSADEPPRDASHYCSESTRDDHEASDRDRARGRRDAADQTGSLDGARLRITSR